VEYLISILVACLLGGCLAYCLLSVWAVRSYLRQPRGTVGVAAVSVLKPLSGADEGLEENLRSFFHQQHPAFEILCAVREPGDAAVPVVEKLQREFPEVTSRLIVTGQPPYANAKVFSLSSMLAEARYDLLVMSDSDIRVGPCFLQSVAAEFGDSRVGLATCPYRAVAGASMWSALEAEGMNTEFLGGLLVARLLLGVDFAVGPTIVARRQVLDAVGFDRLKEYLAEDFVLGKFAREAGFRVILARTIVQHYIGSEGLRANIRHRLRWARSTRRSRPFGYFGQIFTNPIPVALLLWSLQPGWWFWVIGALLLRALAAWAVAGLVLKGGVRWSLLPLQDLLSFAFWIAGFFGNTVIWRGRRYHLHPDGRFEPT
jgi:ceramide glucosyltransferase